MRRFAFFALSFLAVPALLSGCKTRLLSEPGFTEPLRLGGKDISPEVLNEGRDAYLHYCYACHGKEGDGRGPSAPGMRPAPRDFRAGLFKFGGVPVGQLPHDEDLERIIATGLHGTPMLPWDLSDRERHAVVQYLKTFSPRWKEEAPGERIEVTPDPWAGNLAEAREVGKRIYHLSGVESDAEGNPKYFLVGCSNCHPSYISIDERITLSKKYAGAPPAALASLGDMYRPALKPSEYLAGDHALQILPIDFLFHPIKNGDTLPELYRTIAAGVAGAAMPAWKGVLDEQSLWALTHYVRSLVDLRGTPAALTLRKRLLAQPEPATVPGSPTEIP